MNSVLDIAETFGTSRSGLVIQVCMWVSLYYFSIALFCCYSDRDECFYDSPCDINANCTNTEGSFLCTCREGYKGNGSYCEGKKYCIYSCDE